MDIKEGKEGKTNIIYEHIHMESRKILLMNLFTEKKQRRRH